jgi:hypothetical protein
MAEPVTHYAHSTAGLVGDIAPRIACGTAHWAAARALLSEGASDAR